VRQRKALLDVGAFIEAASIVGRFARPGKSRAEWSRGPLKEEGLCAS